MIPNRHNQKIRFHLWSSSRSYLHCASLHGCSPILRHPLASVEIEPRYYGLRDINEKDGCFEADVGLKISWNGEESQDCPLVLSSEHLASSELEQTGPTSASFWRPGWLEISRRSRMKSSCSFALHNFPFDLHKLRVIYKIPSIAAVSSILVKQQDRSIANSPDLGLQDFFVLRSRAYLRVVSAKIQEVQRRVVPPELNSYESTALLADLNTSPPSSSTQPSTFSQINPPELVIEFQLQRRAVFWVTTVLLPLLAMEIFVPLSFAISLSDVASRLIMTSTILLTAVVFKSSLMERLPPTGYATLMDLKFIFLYAITLFASIAHTIIGLMAHCPFQSVVNLALASFFTLILLAHNILLHFQHYRPYNKRIDLFVERAVYTPSEVRISETWSSEKGI